MWARKADHCSGQVYVYSWCAVPDCPFSHQHLLLLCHPLDYYYKLLLPQHPTLCHTLQHTLRTRWLTHTHIATHMAPHLTSAELDFIHTKKQAGLTPVQIHIRLAAQRANKKIETPHLTNIRRAPERQSVQTRSLRDPWSPANVYSRNDIAHGCYPQEAHQEGGQSARSSLE